MISYKPLRDLTDKLFAFPATLHSPKVNDIFFYNEIEELRKYENTILGKYSSCGPRVKVDESYYYICSNCKSVVLATNDREGKPSIGYFGMEHMNDYSLCFTCGFWKRYADDRYNPRHVRIKGVHYVIGDEDSKGFRGFGGQKFKIKFLDGRYKDDRILTTTNLWYQGEIERYKEMMPDNAEFVKE